MQPLILASSSPYRRELLTRLCNPFDYRSPEIDETPLAGEQPVDLVMRLAQLKAQRVAETLTHGLIIASDQVACLEQQILTKPDGFDNACAQLSQCSDKTVSFYTSLALLNVTSGLLQLSVEVTAVSFRPLTREQITRYLQAETPYDCAGSFKAEGLGISLFKSIRSDDPTSLIGLPLIRLVEFLQNEGVEIP